MKHYLFHFTIVNDNISQKYIPKRDNGTTISITNTTILISKSKNLNMAHVHKINVTIHSPSRFSVIRYKIPELTELIRSYKSMFSIKSLKNNMIDP